MTHSYEHWYDAGRQTEMVRCSCWRHMAVYVPDATGGGSFIATDNGFVRKDRPYPHSDRCPARSR
jgi:hypothetical protein